MDEGKEGLRVQCAIVRMPCAGKVVEHVVNGERDLMASTSPLRQSSTDVALPRYVCVPPRDWPAAALSSKCREWAI